MCSLMSAYTSVAYYTRTNNFIQVLTCTVHVDAKFLTKNGNSLNKILSVVKNQVYMFLSLPLGPFRSWNKQKNIEGVCTEASSLVILPTCKKPEVFWPEADIRWPLSQQSHSPICIRQKKAICFSLAITRNTPNRDREKSSGQARLCLDRNSGEAEPLCAVFL